MYYYSDYYRNNHLGLLLQQRTSSWWDLVPMPKALVWESRDGGYADFILKKSGDQNAQAAAVSAEKAAAALGLCPLLLCPQHPCPHHHSC